MAASLRVVDPGDRLYAEVYRRAAGHHHRSARCGSAPRTQTGHRRRIDRELDDLISSR